MKAEMLSFPTAQVSTKNSISLQSYDRNNQVMQVGNAAFGFIKVSYVGPFKILAKILNGAM